jgi:membrane-bound lytic murein transglycosylase D
MSHTPLSTAGRISRASLAIMMALGACASLWEHDGGAISTTDVAELEPLTPEGRCPDLMPSQPAWAPAPPTTPQTALQVPSSMKKRVALWTRVWRDMSEAESLIVDRQRPWLVWAQADCRNLQGDDDVRHANCGAQITAALRAARARLNAGGDDVIAAYGDAAAAREAGNRLMGIRGRKEPLARAMTRARGELSQVEAIFEAEGVPPALARTAFVESLWRSEAQSRSGAVGTFQFTAATGKTFLTVNALVDERKDTLRAAVAAARYLGGLERSFGSWPLALTAYNTGPTRLRRVLKARGTRDLGVVADAGDIDGFGFDGQNYVAQIAAVIAATSDDPMMAPAPIVAMSLTEERSFADVASCLDVRAEALAESNPALAAIVTAGDVDVPAGFVVRVPAAVDDFVLASL